MKDCDLRNEIVTGLTTLYTRTLGNEKLIHYRNSGFNTDTCATNYCTDFSIDFAHVIAESPCPYCSFVRSYTRGRRNEASYGELESGLTVTVKG